MQHRILIVDDEKDILDLLQYNLEKKGYKTATAKNGVKAIEKAKKFKPHLVLLDIMMPEMDGIETTRVLRKTKGFENVVIALLTALNEDFAEITGFQAGADDFIAKPIKPNVLISRISALLRRHHPDTREENSTIQAGDITLDKERYLVIKNGEEFVLPRKEFELLALMMARPGKVFRRETIMNRIWGEDVIVGDRTIDVHIRKLREKIGEDKIKTIKGVGYKFAN